MAVDSAAKRAAAAGAGRPWMRSQVADAAGGAAWRQSAGNGYVLSLAAPAVSAAVTGTVVSPGATEADIRAGGQTIIITLANDTWVAAGAAPIGSEVVSQAIIDGVVAATSPALGWNDEVRDKEVTTSISRDSDTQATITLTASPLYDIASDELIQVVVPIAALVTTSEGFGIFATPQFTITAVAAAAGAGGGGERWHRRKRKLVLAGRVYEVETLREEQQLLDNYIEARKAELPEMAPAKKRATKISIRKAEKRVDLVEDKLAKLREDDEEVLLLFSVTGGF